MYPYAMQAQAATDLYQRDLDAIANDPELSFLLEEEALRQALERYQVAFFGQLRQGALANELHGLGLLDKPFYKFLKVRLQTNNPGLKASHSYWLHLFKTATRITDRKGVDSVLGYQKWLSEVFAGWQPGKEHEELLFRIAHTGWFKNTPNRKRFKAFAGLLVQHTTLHHFQKEEAEIAFSLMLDLLQRIGDYTYPCSGKDILNPVVLRQLATCMAAFTETGIPILSRRFGHQQAGYILRRQGFRLFSHWLCSRHRQLGLELQEQYFLDPFKHLPMQGTTMFEWLPAIVLGNFEKVPDDLILHLCQGKSLRTAPSLVLPLPPRAAHYFTQLGAEDSWDAACIKARVESIGGTELLTRELHQHTWRLREWEDDAFVSRLIEYLVRYQDRIPHHEVRPLLDFFHHIRQIQPGFSLKGRTPEALLRQMSAWHEELALAKQLSYLPAKWKPLPIKGLLFTDRKKQRFRVVQLCTAMELFEEGKALRHCVSSYAMRAARGDCSIWSLRRLGDDDKHYERMVTIELDFKRRIVQVRGLRNRMPDNQEIKILQIWMKEAGLR